MPVKLAVIMDPIATIKTYKDSTFAMMLAAQKRNWELLYIEQQDLFMRDGRVYAHAARVTVEDNKENWYQLEEPATIPLDKIDIVLMRKDPPFDMEYLYSTQLLERAEVLGAMVVNRPSSIRDINEKLFTGWFNDCCVPALVTHDARQIREFMDEQGEIILKPLNEMGGASIFKLTPGDGNTSVIIETLTQHGKRLVMAQRFIPEISAGDKRILMIDGEPVPYALARIPAKGEVRGNLAAGGRGEGIELSARDRWICEQVGPVLKEKGLVFVGIDVIGDYLTEINVTSPTCIRELDQQYGLDIAGDFMDCLESRLAQHREQNR